MDKFENHLINEGLYFKSAARYAKVVANYIGWLKINNLHIEKIKRSRFTDWLQTFREQGHKQRTIDYKENVVFQYYCFLGTSNNPAISWIVRKDEYKIPPVPVAENELIQLYGGLVPKTLVDYRNRCMLGFIVFQGLKRIELEEMRTGDVNFQTGTVFVHRQRKSNSRYLKLEPVQLLHLYEYVKKYRKKLLQNKKDADTDKFFISAGRRKNLESLFTLLLRDVRIVNPQIKNLYHIRTSVIAHWLVKHGLMEAMIMAGHYNIATTKRYETKKYDELQQLLKNVHPMETIDFIAP